MKLTAQKLEGWATVTCMILTSAVFARIICVTERQTERQNCDSICAQYHICYRLQKFANSKKILSFKKPNPLGLSGIGLYWVFGFFIWTCSSDACWLIEVIYCYVIEKFLATAGKRGFSLLSMIITHLIGLDIAHQLSFYSDFATTLGYLKICKFITYWSLETVNMYRNL